MRLFITILLLFPFFAYSTIYYVSTSDGNDSDAGTSEALAWLTIAKVNASSFSAGDQILFKRGDSWVEGVVVPSSGSSGNPITFGAYGTGAKPIITTRKSISGWNTSGNWTNTGTNIWMWDNVSNPPGKAFRIWLNGVEYDRAATGAGVTSVKRTNHLTTTNDLYVYATSNPATFYTNIENSGTINQTFYIPNRNYITVENLDIRAGGGATIIIANSTNLIIQDCDIGFDAQGYGLITSTTANDVIFRRNTVDSGDRFEHDFNVLNGVWDGVSLNGGCNRWEIYQNTIRDWGHSNIEISNISNSNPMTDIIVRDNLVSAEFVDYCRGIAVDGILGSTCTGIKVYRNIFENHPVRIQLNLNGLEFSYNIVNNTRNCLWQEDTGEGIFLAGYSNTDPRSMKIYNNTFCNNAQAGLWIGAPYGGAHNDIQGNLIKNNIFYGNGHEANNDGLQDLPDYQIVAFDGTDALDNTFQNNIFFKTGVTDLIYYGHDGSNDYPHTIAEFNAENGTASDVISGNINADPLFNDPDDDFTLQSASPAKNEGLTLTGFETGLNPSSVWPLSVVTRSQSGSWDIGAFVYDLAKYYISNGGSDAAAGTLANPWQTISKINSSTFNAGDTILFNKGNQWREQLTLPSSGAVNNRIVFTSYGTGAKPIINGADIETGWTSAGSNQWYINNPNAVTTRAMVIIDNVIYAEVASLAAVNSANEYFIDVSATPDRVYVYSTDDPDLHTVEVSNRDYCIITAAGASSRKYIEIADIEVRYAGRAGIYFEGPGSGVGDALNGASYVRRCKAYANRLFGIVHYDHYDSLTVEDSRAEYNGNGFYSWQADEGSFRRDTASNQIFYIVGSNTSDGGAVQGYQSDNWLVENCYSDSDYDAIHIDAGNIAVDATIRYNKVFNSRSGSPDTPGYGIGNTASGSVVNMYYNLAVNCAEASQNSSSAAHAGTINVYNNTFYHNTSTGTSGIVYFNHGTGYTFKNNLIIRDYVAGELGFVIITSAMSTNNYNNYYILNNVSGTLRNWFNGSAYTTMAAWRTATSQDANSITVNPLFVNVASDWSLQATSPCINAGVSVGLTQDINGNPIVGLPDIGAFEYAINVIAVPGRKAIVQ